MSEWRNTTHDWAGSVDLDHLARIRRNREEFAPGGVAHLVLEVLAYAAEEAESTGGGRAVVTVHSDGHGGFVKKPVMSTKDLRFFDSPEPEKLPDGHPRRGVPVTELSPIADDGTTGTTVAGGRRLNVEVVR